MELKKLPVELKKLPETRSSILAIFQEFEVEEGKETLLPTEVIQQRKMHLMMKALLRHQHGFSLINQSEFISFGSQMVAEAGGNVNALSQEENVATSMENTRTKSRAKI